MSDRDQLTKAEFYYSLARERLQAQEKLDAEHGTKAYWVLSLAVGVLAAGALLLRLVWGTSLDATANQLTYVFSLMTLVAMAATVSFSAWVIYLHKHWNKGPKLESVQEAFPEHQAADLMESVGDEFVGSVRHNANLIDQRGGVLRLAIWTLVLEVAAVLALGLVVAVQLLSQ